jgi:hypothetical protein
MPQPRIETIEHWIGDTHVITFPVTGRKLHDVTVDWWVGRSETASGDNIWIKKTSTQPGEITISGEQANWMIEITVLPEDTVWLKPGHWYHETRLASTAGDYERLVLGPYILHPSLIRP